MPFMPWPPALALCQLLPWHHASPAPRVPVRLSFPFLPDVQAIRGSVIPPYCPKPALPYLHRPWCPTRVKPRAGRSRRETYTRPTCTIPAAVPARPTDNRNRAYRPPDCGLSDRSQPPASARPACRRSRARLWLREHPPAGAVCMQDRPRRVRLLARRLAGRFYFQICRSTRRERLDRSDPFQPVAIRALLRVAPDRRARPGGHDRWTEP